MLHAAVLLVALVATPSHANETDALIDNWYAALQSADADRLAELLSANAVIKLNDLGTSQTKAEFIDSMTEWKSAIEGGTISHKSDGEVDGASAWKVCYKFKSNELLTREVFTIAAGKVEASEQTTLKDSCAEF